jgi:nitrogen fixation/metabolism regulation signal transduction histidine kinase
MVYKRFRVSVVAQVALILLVCVAAAYLIATTAYYATIALVLIVLGIQVATLLHYVQRTNRDLSRFLMSIEHSDFSQTFSTERSVGPFAKLADAFESVLERFREARSAKEEQAGYLNTLVQHVPIAVIAADRSGRLDLFNNAARRLFGVAELRNLHDLESFSPDFADEVLALEAGEQELMKVMRNNELLQLNVSVTELRMRGRDLKIITLQDIRRELEARELTAWQNLIRVLTHEIMNSITPISSLAATASALLDDVQDKSDAAATIRDAKDAVNTIAQRGSGLLHFVDSYRQLTHLPKPTLQAFSVEALFSRIKQLMGPDLAARSIKISSFVAKETAELTADEELLEHAIINLVKNSIHAISAVDSPEIHMSAYVDALSRPTIVIADNGLGMTEAIRENIFVPFYTTKRDGTGIGLNVVQQIMRSHRGTVEVTSASGEGTAVRLTF